jgi:hypothetical protein
MSAVQAQDLVAVRSRVSWGAIFAGAVTALAVYLLFSTLGVAVGFSVSDSVGDRELGIGATIWAIAAMLISLFLGGWVSSQCSVGENRQEAVVYGIIVWGVMFAMLLWLMAGGIRIGFNAVMGVMNAPAAGAMASRLSDDELRAAGFTQEQVDSLRGQFERLRARAQNLPNEMRAAAQSPNTSAAAWWTFAGIALSMLASIGGALAGSGPTLTFGGIRLRTGVLQTTTTREGVVR